MLLKFLPKLLHPFGPRSCSRGEPNLRSGVCSPGEPTKFDATKCFRECTRKRLPESALSKAREPDFEPDSHAMYWSTTPDDTTSKIEALRKGLLKNHHSDFGSPRASLSGDRREHFVGSPREHFVGSPREHPTMTSDGFFIP